MKKTTVLAAAMAAAGAILSLVSYKLLPDTVTTQLSLGGASASTMPKALAVALPALLTLGGSLAALLSKSDESAKSKGLIVAGVGLVVFAIMLAVNL